MNLKKCENGHFYNPALTDSCPVCSNNTMGIDNNGTVAIDPMPSMSVAPNMGGETVPVTPGNNFNVFNPVAEEDPRTVPVIFDKVGGSVDPVVGWLVCISGNQLGRDYRLHDGYNRIGRSERMDVCIQGDDLISREDQAYVLYDARSRSFFFVAGEGRNVLYVNNQLALKGMTMPLKAYDVINMGNTTLLFIPMCGQDFDWYDVKKEG